MSTLPEPQQHEPCSDAYAAEDARAVISALAVSGEQADDAVDDAELFAPLTEAEVQNCVFSAWYPQFAKVTFKSEVIRPLDRQFTDYLVADGVFVPGERKMEYHDELESFGSSSDGEWSDNEEEGEAVQLDLEPTSAEITRRIAKLGGSVFPRMAWSAPTDAAWASTTGTLKCTEAADIYWLLKSSDKIIHDLAADRYPLPAPVRTEPELVLRQWANLHPSMVFRGFVRDHKLIGVSQVDVQHHAFLHESSSEIYQQLTDFFDAHVAKFPSASFCFDAYIARSVNRVLVMDFEPWSHVVDSCLFEWSELVNAQEPLGLRLFPEGVNPIGHFTAKYSTNRFPVEMTADAYHGSIAALIEKMQTESKSQN
ncbi:hypothetical protein IWW55_000546 [Coemansia sp. RSA 2706]|nr:hypothetical protein IWW55_000546 [Coemansia sp. RSA 2706]KAJ2329481.1 hypothetical protein IWW51_000579 [Coemansia sp. RSA 2702]